MEEDILRRKLEEKEKELEKKEEEVKRLSCLLETNEKERQDLLNDLKRQTQHNDDLACQLYQLMTEALKLRLCLVETEQEKMITELEIKNFESTMESVHKVKAKLKEQVSIVFIPLFWYEAGSVASGVDDVGNR